MWQHAGATRPTGDPFLTTNLDGLGMGAAHQPVPIDSRSGGLTANGGGRLTVCFALPKSSSAAAGAVVTGTGSVRAAVESLKLGAVDFLEKPIDHDVLLHTVQQALVKYSAALPEAVEVEAVRHRLADLTDREAELLRLIVRGLANKQI